MSEWQTALLEPVKTILSQIGQFLANLLLMIFILIIGWVVAKFIKALVIRILRVLKLDVLSERIELDALLAKGGIGYSFSELVGVVFYWLTLLVAVMIAVNAIGLTVAADLLNTIVLYVPNIVAAIFILILGMFVATVLKNIVQTAAVNAGMGQSKLFGRLVEVIIVVFAVLIALEQLNIGAKLIELTVTIVLGSLGLGIAIAIGLGCKDTIGKLGSEIIDKIKGK